jgi:hypothetical protein
MENLNLMSLEGLEAMLIYRQEDESMERIWLSNWVVQEVIQMVRSLV